MSASAVPLLSSDQPREDSVEALLQRLHRLIATQELQAVQYFNQVKENRLRAKKCAREENAVGCRHYVQEARKADYYNELELKRAANTKEFARKLREAMVNAETAKNLSAANTTLEQLQQAMPLHQLDDIMDAFQDNSLLVKQQSEALAAPFELDDADVEAELEELMAKAVESKLMGLPPAPQGRGEGKEERVLLKSE